MTAVALEPKLFSRTRIQGFERRKRSGFVVRQQVRSTDRNLYFFKLKLLNFKR